MAADENFKFERFEDYFGDKDEVIKQIDDCKKCGAKLVFTHLPDYKNLLVQETSRCMECGQGGHRTIHIIN